MDPRLIDDLETATFPVALRGYDREAVDAFLGEVATRIERASDSSEVAPGVRRQLDRFGARAGEILSAADEVAEELRANAELEAEGIRVAADEESRRVVLEAGTKAEEILVEADRRAERIIDAGSRRRQDIEAEIAELAVQRDQVAAELRRISQELRVSVVENTRIEPVAEDAEADELDPAPGDTEAEDDDLGYELPELEPPAEVRTSGRFRPRETGDPAEL